MVLILSAAKHERPFDRLRTGRGGSHSNARMDHAPDCPPARQLPLTTVCIANLNRSAKGAPGLSSTAALHVPEYSVLLPETAARQPPVHPVRDFAADHPPLVTGLPLASRTVHVPVTVPAAGPVMAVHVPPSVRPVLLLALHVFCRPS